MLIPSSESSDQYQAVRSVVRSESTGVKSPSPLLSRSTTLDTAHSCAAPHNTDRSYSMGWSSLMTYWRYSRRSGAWIIAIMENRIQDEVRKMM